MAFAASDFVLIPSLFEPCGLPQMVGSIYGSLPVAHDTGGLHDTVDHLDAETSTGNGFIFKNYDSNALSWAIDEAMRFSACLMEYEFHNPAYHAGKFKTVYAHEVCAGAYIDMYEHMLKKTAYCLMPGYLFSVQRKRVFNG